MKPAIVTLSFDDGDPRDLEIARLLKKYDLAATFYIPITNVEGRETLTPEQIVQLSTLGFEIGAHGYHHHYLDRIPASEVYDEIKNGKERLEQILGREVICYCYPGGKIPSVAVEAVRQLGFEYARTIKALRFTVKDPLLAPSTDHIGHHYKIHYIKEALLSYDSAYIIYFLKRKLWLMNWDDIALSNLDYAVKTGGIWHLWGHAFEIDQNNEWARLEHVLAKIQRLRSQGRVISCINSMSVKVDHVR